MDFAKSGLKRLLE